MQHLSQDGDTVVLYHVNQERLGSFLQAPPQANAKLLRGVIIDTETTGLEAYDSTVIEVAVRSFDFDPISNRIARTQAEYTALQEPPEPLSDKISKITGLTDGMLKGQSIDWGVVHEVLSQADIVVAHHADFDRKHVDSAVQKWNYAKSQQQSWQRKVWACTMDGLDWSSLNSPSKSLSVLCWMHGFFFPPHRAANDVDATMMVLLASCKISELYIRSQLPSFEVWAVKAHIDTKEMLKEYGFRWNAPEKTWVLQAATLQHAEEALLWMTDAVYGKAGNRAQIVRTENWQRFK